MPGPPGELMTREKLISSELHEKSPTYGHMAKLFLESEFQCKGNKQTKKRKFSAKSCGFLGSNRFRNNNYLNSTRKMTNKNFGQNCYR